MSNAPERIAVWPAFVGHPSMTGQWSANTHPDNAVAYVRADLSDALIREAAEALENRDGGTHDDDLKTLRFISGMCNCGHEQAYTSLGKLRTHLEGEKE